MQDGGAPLVFDGCKVEHDAERTGCDPLKCFVTDGLTSDPSVAILGSDDDPKEQRRPRGPIAGHS